jgi:hypothetical protein
MTVRSVDVYLSFILSNFQLSERLIVDTLVQVLHSKKNRKLVQNDLTSKLKSISILLSGCRSLLSEEFESESSVELTMRCLLSAPLENKMAFLLNFWFRKW